MCSGDTLSIGKKHFLILPSRTTALNEEYLKLIVIKWEKYQIFTVYNKNFEDTYGAFVSYSCHFSDFYNFMSHNKISNAVRALTITFSVKCKYKDFYNISLIFKDYTLNFKTYNLTKRDSFEIMWLTFIVNKIMDPLLLSWNLEKLYFIISKDELVI